MTALFEAAEAWADLVANSSQSGVVSERLEASFKLADMLDGLCVAPSSKGECNDCCQVGFGAARKAKARHGSALWLGKVKTLSDPREHIAWGDAA